MPIGEVLKRKQELLSQYRVLGIPKEKELQTSDNVVYVHSYTRDDGTEVRAHWRSKPDGIANNNFSHENPTGGASNIDESKQIEQENTINDEELEYNDWDNIDLDTLKDLDEYIDKNIIDIMPDDIREIYEQLKQTQDEELSPALECKVSKQDLLNRIKEFAHYNIKPYRDYENLTPVEKAQKYLSKHMPYWTPNQYYGLSETLADEGKPLDKYKKYNNFCKLGEIKNVQLKEICMENALCLSIININ